MAALTAAATYTESMGSRIIKIFQFSTVNDADTFASGLSGRIVDYWHSQKDNPTTQASAGLSVDESSGTFTFHPGEDGAEVSLFVAVNGY